MYAKQLWQIRYFRLRKLLRRSGADTWLAAKRAWLFWLRWL